MALQGKKRILYYIIQITSVLPLMTLHQMTLKCCAQQGQILRNKIKVSEKTSDLPFSRIDFIPRSADHQIKINRESIMVGCVEGVKYLLEAVKSKFV